MPRVWPPCVQNQPKNNSVDSSSAACSSRTLGGHPAIVRAIVSIVPIAIHRAASNSMS
jgi:hypothetical protein